MPAKIKRRPKPQAVKFRHAQPTVVIWGGVSTPAQHLKGSTDDQMDVLESKVQSFGWKIVDRITVPGFSRNFFTYSEFCEAAAAEGVTEPLRIWDYWQGGKLHGSVDIVACINISRLGREQSIVDEFTGRTYNSGLFMYTLKNGLVQPEQRRTTFMIEGYGAATETEENVRRREHGMKSRSQKGLPPIRPPFSHKYILDTDGDQLAMVVDESKRPLLNLIRDLILDNRSYDQIVEALNARGYRNNGKPFAYNALRRWFLRADVWGNTIDRSARLDVAADRLYGRYCLSPQIKPPEGITVHFGTRPPVWEGEEGHQIREMILNVHAPNAGNARPQRRHKFTRLMICDECHHHIGFSINQSTSRCYGACRYGVQKQMAHICRSNKFIREDRVQAWFVNFFFPRLFAALDPKDWIDQFYEAVPNYADAIEQTEAALKHLRAKGEMYVQKQGDNPAAAALYDAAILTTSQDIARTEDRLRQLQQQSVPRWQPAQSAALRSIRESYATFWEQPPENINNALLQLLGDLRVVVKQGQIVALVPVNAE